MAVKFTNNATSTLASSINSAVTAITIEGADAAKFPEITEAGDWFPVTLIDEGGNTEVLKVTARTGASLTVVRAREGTTAKSFAAGSIIEHRLTAAALNQIYADSRDAAQLTGTLQDAQLSGNYGFGSLTLTGALTVTGSAPALKLLDSTAGQYSSRIQQNNNNLTLEASLDDENFTIVFQFELDSKKGFVDGSQIWTDAYATAAKLASILGGTPVPNTRTVSAGNGLVGGGALSANRTFTLGTPLSITPTSENVVGTDNHGHALGFIPAEVSTATSANTTVFPVGHPITVLKTGARVARNGLLTPCLSSADNYYYRHTGEASAGAALSGVWRSNGYINDGLHFAQRRA